LSARLLYASWYRPRPGVGSDPENVPAISHVLLEGWPSVAMELDCNAINGMGHRVTRTLSFVEGEF
jgi:hypothetical protein